MLAFPREAMTTKSPEVGAPAFVPRDIMFRLSDFVRRVAIAGIKERHPEYDDEHVRLALARLCFGDELVSRAWAGRPLVEP